MTSAWWMNPIAPPDTVATAAAQQRRQQLTKPPGSLGRLEQLAVDLAGMQSSAQPGAERVRIVVFAGDHGVAEEGVSAFPQSVTAEMVRNFARGGAAISVLARALNAELEVVNVGTVHDIEALPGVIAQRVGAGTANLCKSEAMTRAQLDEALSVGYAAVERARAAAAQIFIGGEMGIANTTSATALSCALLQAPAAELTGAGTGLDRKGIARKIGVIERALALHHAQLHTPLDALRCLGGFEIAALAGAYIACAQVRLPAVVDGFISSVAALLAVRMNADVQPWLLFSHRSAEPGHQGILQALDAQPLVDFGMRLGEGSGAALSVPLLRLACELHNRMATFAEAGVSAKT